MSAALRSIPIFASIIVQTINAQAATAATPICPLRILSAFVKGFPPEVGVGVVFAGMFIPFIYAPGAVR
jgi:hypothetical protein